MGPGQGRAAPPYLSSPWNGEGDRVAVEGGRRKVWTLRRVGWKRRRRPSVSSATPPIHLPIEWGGKRPQAVFRGPRQAFRARWARPGGAACVAGRWRRPRPASAPDRAGFGRSSGRGPGRSAPCRSGPRPNPGGVARIDGAPAAGAARSRSPARRTGRRPNRRGGVSWATRRSWARAPQHQSAALGQGFGPESGPAGGGSRVRRAAPGWRPSPADCGRG